MLAIIQYMLFHIYDSVYLYIYVQNYYHERQTMLTFLLCLILKKTYFQAKFQYSRGPLFLQLPEGRRIKPALTLNLYFTKLSVQRDARHRFKIFVNHPKSMTGTYFDTMVAIFDFVT